MDTALTRSVRELEDIRYALDQSAIVATTDVAGRIKSANDKFCEISKYARDELIGQDHRLLNSGHHPKAYIRDLWRTIAQGSVWRGELRNRAKDGTFYWVDTTIVPFLDERGHPWQYMAIRYDITERKRQEALLREQAALTRVGELAAVVAHEVRNPIAGIRGALEIIAKRMPAASSDVGVLKDVVGRLDGLNDTSTISSSSPVSATSRWGACTCVHCSSASPAGCGRTRRWPPSTSTSAARTPPSTPIRSNSASCSPTCC